MELLPFSLYFAVKKKESFQYYTAFAEAKFSILKDIAAGMAYMHKKGLMHRGKMWLDF
jgi:hypothetical protein